MIVPQDKKKAKGRKYQHFKWIWSRKATQQIRSDGWLWSLKPVWIKRTKVSPTSLFINVHSGELCFNRSRQQKARVGEILMRICAILSFVVRLLSSQFRLMTLEESQMWFELLRFSVFLGNFHWKISFLKEFRLSLLFHVPVWTSVEIISGRCCYNGETC